MKLFDLAVPVVVFFLIGGPNALTRSELDLMLKVTKRQFREHHLTLRPRIVVRKDPLPVSTLQSWHNDYWKLGRMFFREGREMIIRGPIIEPDGTRFVAGKAQRRCAENNFAVIWAQAKSSIDGSSRISQSGTAASHEFGHLCGLSHQTELQVSRDGPTIMNADAGNISVSQALHFSWPEAAKIRECLCSRICKPGDMDCEINRCIYG